MIPFLDPKRTVAELKDTREEHLELGVVAFDRLAEKAMRWIASGAGRRE